MIVEPSDYFRTPAAIFAPLNAKHRFACDLFASPENTLAPTFFHEEISALDHTWPRGAWSYANPPYSRGWLPAVTAKARQEAEAGASVVMLIPATPGASWFQRNLFAGAQCFDNCQYPKHSHGALSGVEHRYSLNGRMLMAVRWLESRPRFLNADGSPSGSSGVRDACLVFLSKERFW